MAMDANPDEKIVAGRIQKVVFASDELPAGLGEEKRFRLWRDRYTALYGSCELSAVPDRRFSARIEFVPIGAVGAGRFEGTISRVGRTARDVAADGAANFCLGVNAGLAPMSIVQNGRETVLATGMAVLLTNAEAGEVGAAGGKKWFALNVSRKRLLEHVAHADDLVAAPLDHSSESSRHLSRYLDVLLGPEGIEDDRALAEHVGTTLVDLVALVLGAGGDVARTARMRGLRAARVRAVLAEIKAGFACPACSSASVARKLGLSQRYVNDLLLETGVGFSERVLELRLQQARAMLSDQRNDHMRIGEIAYACGFNEVSYFNRCFRRRFGATPTQFRGGG